MSIKIDDLSIRIGADNTQQHIEAVASELEKDFHFNDIFVSGYASKMTCKRVSLTMVFECVNTANKNVVGTAYSEVEFYLYPDGSHGEIQAMNNWCVAIPKKEA